MVEQKASVNGKEVSRWVRGTGVEYCLRTEPHEVFQTKFRMPGDDIPDCIVDPTYDKVVSLINGNQE
jgi:hypothetical protein